MSSEKEYFLTRFRSDRARNGVWKAITAHLQRYIPENSDVLDVGAGYCSFINNIRAGKKFAVDVYGGFAEFAAPGVITSVAGCTDMKNIGSNICDVVFSSNLFEHLTIPGIRLTINEIKRILRPGGRLILLLPNFKYCYRTFYDDYTHVTPLTDTGVSDLLSSHGFTVEKIKRRFLPFTIKSRLPKNGLLVRLYLMSPLKPFAGQMLVVAKNRDNDKRK